MKCAIFICFALIAGAFAYNWEPNDEECAKELKIDKAVIDAVPDPFEKPTPEDNKVYNEFTECSWKKDGLLDDKGNVLWEVFDTLIAEELKKEMEKNKSDSEEQLATLLAAGFIKSLIDDCHEIKGDNPGHTAVKIQNCIGNKFRSVPDASSSEEST